MFEFQLEDHYDFMFWLRWAWDFVFNKMVAFVWMWVLVVLWMRAQ